MWRSVQIGYKLQRENCKTRSPAARRIAKPGTIGQIAKPGTPVEIAKPGTIKFAKPGTAKFAKPGTIVRNARFLP